MNEIGLWFAALCSFLIIGLFIAICDPGKEERERKEQQRFEQKLQEEKWLIDNCKLIKEVSGGFVPRSIYKCKDGSKRVINHYLERT